MASEEILVIGGGLAGLSAAYYLSKKYKIMLIEDDEWLGGYFAYDDYDEDGSSGKELYHRFLNCIREGDVNISTLSTGFKKSGSIYILKQEKLLHWNDLVISATGFRCRTLTELGIYGYRPAGIYCINTVMEILRDGFVPGEKPIIYGLNRFSISLINRLLDIDKIKEVNLISNESYNNPIYKKFLENNGVNLIPGEVIWINSLNRVSSVILDNRTSVEGDSLIISKLIPFNYLNINYSVGNASMIVANPSKVIDLSRIFVENLIDILNGALSIELPCNVSLSPRNISRNIRKVMTGYEKGTKLIIDDKTVVLKEDYEVIELPDIDKITIEVVK